jgi:ADP-ribosylglycohydrolase
MRLTTAQTDRAAGALLGAAAGDALGVPYEFSTPPGPGRLAQMVGGGLGNFSPGEWSDDTSMAVAIARVGASGADLTSDDALDAIAAGFLEWYAAKPPDIGIQTRKVLESGSRRVAREESRPGVALREEATAYALSHPRSAGNGALMRTAPVALRHLDDRDKCATAARAIASLTHADPLAGDSCVIWSEAIRHAVVLGALDVTAGLDLVPQERRAQWTAWLRDACDVERNLTELVPGARFTRNGFTVTALQAAVAAIWSTEVPDLEPGSGRFPCLHLQAALHAAVRIGNDTDTVGAIAGALLGARWGASAVPWRWRSAVHGWPGLSGRDLVDTATLAVRDGVPDRQGWPGVASVPYDETAVSEVVPHPHDPGVLLGTHRSRDHTATAVVSACRVGKKQTCFGSATEIVESRLMDRDAPADNPNLHFALFDAADAVRGLRQAGHTVLLHCVAAQQRTPSIALTYSTLLGHDVDVSRRLLLESLPSARGSGRVWRAASEVGDSPLADPEEA